MLTEKLYEKDSYLSEFDAQVLSVESDGALCHAVLDRTAFFPEGGGQYADRGTICGYPVTDVQIKNGEIVHTVSGALTRGDTVHGVIDFALRYRRMQNHSGEHIVSGIVHRLYGYDNVGFHLGDDDVTLDFSGELTREQLDELERLANRAVWENKEISVAYPTPSELASLTYRSKLDLTENVRIVSVGDVDVCACCAPHVARTGEIGLIKLLDFMRYKGGIRLHILCGESALSDYGKRYFETLALSQMLSVKQYELQGAVSQLLCKNEELKQEIKALRRDRLAAKIAALKPKAGNVVIVLSSEEKELVREAVNLSLHLADGAVVAIAGDDASGWRYAIGSHSIDLRAASRAINSALSGRGGGREIMIEGSFLAKLDEITAYFESTDLGTV
jgi:alanyl-tRNA synthetase